MKDHKQIEELLKSIPAISKNSPYDTLYMAGVGETLSWVLGRGDNPLVVSKDKQLFCDKCKTDLVRLLDEKQIKICLQCKSFTVKSTNS